MSLHRKTHLNSTRRRNRKAQLAARDGQRCAYCRRPFAELREATLDHVVPIRLLFTWSANHLVLACRPCNNAKADRLPLSLALLIARSADPGQSTVAPIDCRLLARLAAAHQAALTSVTHCVTPGVTPAVMLRSPDLISERSTRSLHESTPRTCPRSNVPPDCLRAPRPARACAGPTGQAVPA
ncbi:HNH endonuclease [Streptomyces huiliensis]|uniref:HNH endonuclease n=1 Tax=Streptomyces huiliensis TaxID=2876027 RepID=UPI001CC10746|nr:HNH endonuclease [Streptomyces huiliensis]